MSNRTFCRICEAACGLTVERGPGGVVERLRPDREHPVSAGFVCAKGTRFAEVARHPARLLRPHRRQGGRLAPTHWETAYRLVAERVRPIIERYGPHAVAIYWGNPLAFNALGMFASMLLARALGTRNVYSAGSQDCNNKFAGARLIHGSPFVQPIPDLDRCDLAVMLGTNPAVSQSSFVHLPGGARSFDRLVERGADVVWVDPRRTESAARWGRHLSIRPGTDAWLLLALLAQCAGERGDDQYVEGLSDLLAMARHVTPERAATVTGIPAADIRALAAQIVATPRVCLHMSVGVNQGPLGTLSYVALQALSYVTGNLDAEGGHLFHPLARPLDGLLRRVIGVGDRQHTSRVGGFASTLDTLPGGILADEILTPGPERVRALIVVAGDPLRSIPGADRLEEAFGALDLLVCVDLFESLTARHADVVLPTPTWLERADLALPGLVLQTSPLAQTTPRVASPPPHVRHDARVLAELSVALGRPFPGARLLSKLPVDDILSEAIAAHQRFSSGPGVPIPAPRAGTWIGRGPLNPGRRLRFWSEALAAEAARLPALEDVLGAAGYRLMGRRRRLGHNSWLHGGVRDGRSESTARLHPDDLRALSLSEGTIVRLQTEAGALQLPVEADDGVSRGVVVVPHGLPDANVNRLIPAGEAHVERASGMLWMTGIPVTIDSALA